ncbi:LAFE_0C06260g1_1 [Lachancea fermentati]|uniref:LAFE_0C06260g1_1 n=1 Tax=Lachancea fermentati TaxID=4955 RepID=A0A1G4M9J3_LACFM|nr:LAFE_0C06260g1_1 [Lachancea fermentati]
MGLCASKEDHAVSSGTTKTTQPLKKERVTRRAPISVSKAQAKDTKKRTTSSAGHVLSSEQAHTEMPAKSAAGKAAAERFEQSQKQSTQGELGKKLAKERAKSRNAHLKESAEQRQQERNEPLVFD